MELHSRGHRDVFIVVVEHLSGPRMGTVSLAEQLKREMWCNAAPWYPFRVERVDELIGQFRSGRHSAIEPYPRSLG
jgi:hypothetical protein